MPDSAIAAQDDVAAYYTYCKTATKSFTKCQNSTAPVGIEGGICLQCITFLVDCQLQTPARAPPPLTPPAAAPTSNSTAHHQNGRPRMRAIAPAAGTRTTNHRWQAHPGHTRDNMHPPPQHHQTHPTSPCRVPPERPQQAPTTDPPTHAQQNHRRSGNPTREASIRPKLLQQLQHSPRNPNAPGRTTHRPRATRRARQNLPLICRQPRNLRSGPKKR